MARAAREDVSRQYVIKRVTNIFATAALIDAGVSYGILIYLLNRSSILRDISSLVASVQLVCLLPISIITALIMIRSGASYQTRLDAIGAWTLVCLLNLLGNAGFGFSVLWPDFDVVFNMSITFTVLLIWKAFFVLLQLTSLVYSLCVLNNPVKYVNEDSPRRIEVQPRPSEPPKNDETYDKIQNTQPPSHSNSSSALMLHGKSNPAYESYLSLANSASSSNVSRPTQKSNIHLANGSTGK